jgi:beta-lactamase class D
MNRLVRSSITLLVTVGFIATIFWQTMQSGVTVPNQSIAAPIKLNVAPQDNFNKHFKDLGVEGSISIYDANTDRLYQHNPARNDRAFGAASTFKILNSLIALETNVIPNELAILTWDGIPRQLPEWNRDLNLREAIKVSAVWFYQVLARRVGVDRMQQFITQVGYGNQKIGTKEQIDRFWLDTELQITPQQQIQFLRRLYKNELPFSQRNLAIVKDILIVEQTPDYTLRGKTGMLDSTYKLTAGIGWYVGYLERGKNVYFFATNLDIRTKKDAAARKELTRRCFKTLGLL